MADEVMQCDWCKKPILMSELSDECKKQHMCQLCCDNIDESDWDEYYEWLFHDEGLSGGSDDE